MATQAIERRSVTAWIIALVFLAVLLNYIDRGAIAIAAPLLKPELGLSATQFGLAVSAFFWIYAPIQLGVGWAMDRWCVYRLLAALPPADLRDIVITRTTQRSASGGMFQRLMTAMRGSSAN